jgi:hypothetical protein
VAERDADQHPCVGLTVVSLQQRQRPPGEVVGRITVGVLVANIEGRVLVSYHRGLIDEVGHGLLVTFGADI